MNRREFIKEGLAASFGILLTWLGMAKAEDEPDDGESTHFPKEWLDLAINARRRIDEDGLPGWEEASQQIISSAEKWNLTIAEQMERGMDPIIVYPKDGRSFWFDPTNGDDANDGLTPETSLLTPEEIVSRCKPSDPVTFTFWCEGGEWRCDETH